MSLHMYVIIDFCLCDVFGLCDLMFVHVSCVYVRCYGMSVCLCICASVCVCVCVCGCESVCACEHILAGV